MTNAQETLGSWGLYNKPSSHWGPTDLVFSPPQDDTEDNPINADIKESLFPDSNISPNFFNTDSDSSANVFTNLNREVNGHHAPSFFSWNSNQVEAVWSPVSTNKTVDWSLSSTSTWKTKTPFSSSADQNILPIPDKVPTNVPSENVFQNLWLAAGLTPLAGSPLPFSSQSTWNTKLGDSAGEIKSNRADSENTVHASGSSLDLDLPTQIKSPLEHPIKPSYSESHWSVCQEESGNSHTHANEETVNEGIEDSDLFSKLINAKDGWGVGFVDQSTPWTEPNDSTVVSPGSVARDEQQSTSASFASAAMLSSQESNVWTNEPPTGTGIWEMYYEQQSKRTARWQQQLGLMSGQDLFDSACPTPMGSILSAACGRLPQPSAMPNHFQPSAQEAMPWSFNSRPAYGLWMPSACGQDALVSPTHPQHQPLSDSTSHLTAAAKLAGNTRRTSALNNNCNNLFQSGPENSTLRPLLGGNRRTSPPSEADGFAHNFQEEQAWMNRGGWNPLGLASFDDDTASDDWSRAKGSKPALLVDDNKPVQTGAIVHPYSHTYRADLVKHFMQLGYKKEDVQAVLIDCNMEVERSLAQLRRQYLQVRPPTTQSRPPFPRSDFSGSSLAQMNGEKTFDLGNQFSLPPPQTGRLMKQQQQQQVRMTAGMTGGRVWSLDQLQQQQGFGLRGQQLRESDESLNGMPHKNLAPSMNGSSSFGSTAVSNKGSGDVNNACSAISNKSVGPLPPGATTMSTDGGVPPFRVSLLGLPPPAQVLDAVAASQLRTQRQWAIYNSIQELQKKQQDIIKQMQLYRSNSALCAQPQCAAVFNELQFQLQNIESQLRKKDAQLNLTPLDPTAAVAVGEAAAQQPLPSTSLTPSTSVFPPPAQQQTGNQNKNFKRASLNHFANNSHDALTQKFMEMRLHNGPSSPHNGNAKGGNNHQVNGFRGNNGIRFPAKTNLDGTSQAPHGQWMLLRQHSSYPLNGAASLLETVQSSLVGRGLGLTHLHPVVENQGRGYKSGASAAAAAALAHFQSTNEAMEAVQLLNYQPIAISLLNDRDAHALLVNGDAI